MFYWFPVAGMYVLAVVITSQATFFCSSKGVKVQSKNFLVFRNHWENNHTKNWNISTISAFSGQCKSSLQFINSELIMESSLVAWTSASKQHVVVLFFGWGDFECRSNWAFVGCVLILLNRIRKRVVTLIVNIYMHWINACWWQTWLVFSLRLVTQQKIAAWKCC